MHKMIYFDSVVVTIILDDVEMIQIHLVIEYLVNANLVSIMDTSD